MTREMGWNQKSLLYVLTEASLVTFLLILQWSVNHLEVIHLHLDPKEFEGFWIKDLFHFKNLVGLYPQE